MDLILDTHLLLWAATAPASLLQGMAEIIEDDRNALHCSVASLWEIAVKSGLRRPEFALDPRVFRTRLAATAIASWRSPPNTPSRSPPCPTTIGDPFDRILMGQSIAEGITLVTADPVVARYPGPIRLFRR